MNNPNPTHECTSRCNNDIDCPMCEHGYSVDNDEVCPICDDQALDAQDALNVPNDGDFTGYFNHEQLL